MHLSVSHRFLPKRPSAHAAAVMDHFGIDFETGEYVIADDLELPIEPADVVAFTGPSGSGKSSLLRAAADQLADVLDVASLDLGDEILVDRLGLPFGETLRLLTACGLGEARLLLRTPAELSDGQRFRFRLALAVAQKPQWLVCDEFSATLDRTLAQVLAYNVRRLATRERIGFLLATTHEDVLGDLQPDLHVACDLDGRIEAVRPDVEKKVSASLPTSGSVPVPVPIGRTSLGGITAVTPSASYSSSPSCGTSTAPSAFVSSPPPRSRSVPATAGSA